MQLSFVVGDREQHRVRFQYNKFWGKLMITVDDDVIEGERRLYSTRLKKSYTFTVGDREAHDVRIDTTRALLLGGFRAQPVRAYVDDVLVAEGVA